MVRFRLEANDVASNTNDMPLSGVALRALKACGFDEGRQEVGIVLIKDIEVRK